MIDFILTVSGLHPPCWVEYPSMMIYLIMLMLMASELLWFVLNYIRMLTDPIEIISPSANFWGW